jgi:hypothetical protein
MLGMRRYVAGLTGFLLPYTALAQPSLSPSPAPVALHVSYETYAAGIPVAQTTAGLSFNPRTYQVDLAYHTTGLVGLLFSGHQFDHVEGAWRRGQAEPSRFAGQGEWRGVNRSTEIDYQQGKPAIRQLVPPNEDEREPVPEPLQDHSIDTLSALATLIHVVAQAGRCETTVHTYDGRRAVDLEAHTVGEETLEASSRSDFAGKALRCDFSGRMLAGFKFGDDREHDSRPMHGSAWLAPVVAGGPPLPVRMAFETRWFGDATMYMTAIGPGSDIKVAERK